MRFITRSLDEINDSLAPISQKAKDSLAADEVEEAAFEGVLVHPDLCSGLQETVKEGPKNREAEGSPLSFLYPDR